VCRCGGAIEVRWKNQINGKTKISNWRLALQPLGCRWLLGDDYSVDHLNDNITGHDVRAHQLRLVDHDLMGSVATSMIMKMSKAKFDDRRSKFNYAGMMAKTRGEENCVGLDGFIRVTFQFRRVLALDAQ